MPDGDDDSRPLVLQNNLQIERRQLFWATTTTIPTLSLLASSIILSNSDAADAAMLSDQKVFRAGEKLGIDVAKGRFREAVQSLDILLDRYDEILKEGGGDNVRRYLGTVGTVSGLYGIDKVLKELQSEADDIVNYTEAMFEFGYALRAADTAAYSANFVEYSAAKTKPEQFWTEAKKEAQKMKQCLDDMAAELDL